MALRGLKRKLVDRSLDAYVLSLETVNRISMRYRVEVFTYLVCNAWELLLKARIIELRGSNKAIDYPRKRGQPRRTLALQDCLNRVFTSDTDPVRRNIELVTELRDQATHLVIEKVPKEVLALFQACVVNYHQHLGKWWNISLSERMPIGILTLVYDFAPDDFDPENPRLRRSLGIETADYLIRYRDQIRQEQARQQMSSEFAITIEYRLALTKKPTDADIVLGTGEDGTSTRAIEIPKDASRTHPYRQKELVGRMNELLSGRHKINPHDIQSIVKVYGVKQRSEFRYQSKVPGSPVQYSERFAEWIVQEFEKNPNFFADVRIQVKNECQSQTSLNLSPPNRG